MSKLKDVHNVWKDGWINKVFDSLRDCFEALNGLKQPRSRYDQGRSRPPTISPKVLDFQRLFYSVESTRLSGGEEGKERQGYT